MWHLNGAPSITPSGAGPSGAVSEEKKASRHPSARERLRRTEVRVALAIALAASSARGDGGVVRLSQTAGPFEITLFTAPTPLRVGVVDVSVLVQTAADHTPVLDAEVQVALRGPGLERTGAATHAPATNKLLYAALLDVPGPGRWTLAAQVHAGERDATVSCAVDVAPPLPPVVAFWPYFAFPGALIALFALHQWLKRQQRSES